MVDRYKKHATYVDSGVEEIGLVPQKWITSRIAYTFIDNNAGEVIDKSYWGDGKEVLYTCNKTPLKSDFVEFPERKRTTAQDLLLTRNGTPYVHLPCENAIYSNVVQRITLSKKFDRQFLKYCLGNSALFLRGYGVSIESFNFEMWKSLAFAYPEKTEQTQIANFLDHETAKIDTLIDKQQQLIKLLKEKRQAVISHAVTKGLNPDAPMKDSGIEWLGEVPEHWAVSKLSYRYEVLLGKMLDDKKITGAYLGKYLRNTDVQWDRINTEDLPEMDFRPEEHERFSVRKGDLIVCEGGEIGRSAIWEKDEICFYQKALHRLRPNKPSTDYTRFMFYVLFDAVHRERFVSGAGKATIAHLPAETFKQYRFAFPPLKEQLLIADHLDKIKAKFDLIEQKAIDQIELLRERRTALISAAVTGKIDVRNWKGDN